LFTNTNISDIDPITGGKKAISTHYMTGHYGKGSCCYRSIANKFSSADFVVHGVGYFKFTEI
jgi:hypothetical protein